MMPEQYGLPRLPAHGTTAHHRIGRSSSCGWLRIPQYALDHRLSTAGPGRVAVQDRNGHHAGRARCGRRLGHVAGAAADSQSRLPEPAAAAIRWPTGAHAAKVARRRGHDRHPGGLLRSPGGRMGPACRHPARTPGRGLPRALRLVRRGEWPQQTRARHAPRQADHPRESRSDHAGEREPGQCRRHLRCPLAARSLARAGRRISKDLRGDCPVLRLGRGRAGAARRARR